MDGEARAAGWAFVAALGGFKLAVAVTIFLMQPSLASAGLIVALHGYWLVAPFFLLALPTIAWLRLVRARARRRALIRSEWQLEPGSAEWNAPATHGTM